MDENVTFRWRYAKDSLSVQIEAQLEWYTDISIPAWRKIMHEVIKNERQSNLTEHRQGFKGNLSTTFCDQFIFHHLDNEQAL